ncbi:MAG: hypothetical protein HY084_11940 [Gemmatimonadetes bacterium]|nr:hypothetical protein [Gemmatimonadota bacterium]
MRVTDAMFVEAELFATDRLGALDALGRRVEFVRAIEAYANRKWDDACLFMSAHDDLPCRAWRTSMSGLNYFSARCWRWCSRVSRGKTPCGSAGSE